MSLEFTIIELVKRFSIKKIVISKFLMSVSLCLLIFHLSWSQDSYEGNHKNNLDVGLGVGGGIYFPGNSEIREIFGNKCFSFSTAPVVNSNFTDKLVFGGDLHILKLSSNNNRILAIKLGGAINKQFGDESSQIVPHLCVTLGPVYYDYAFKRSGKRVASKAFGLGVSIEIGAKINKKLWVNGKYNLYNAPDNLNLNGFGIDFLYKLF